MKSTNEIPVGKIGHAQTLYSYDILGIFFDDVSTQFAAHA